MPGAITPPSIARRTKLATWRADRRSATGDVSPALRGTLMDRFMPRPRGSVSVSMRPADVGTNISGPRSPTMKARHTGQHAGEQIAYTARTGGACTNVS